MSLLSSTAATAGVDQHKQFQLSSDDRKEQRIINAVLKEATRLDVSIKDFLIHEEDVVRVTCARGTKKLAELFEPANTEVHEALSRPINRNAILCFVIVNLMGARTLEEIEPKKQELQEHLTRKNSYTDSIRLNWGSKIRVMMFRQSKGKLAIVGRVSPLTTPAMDQIGLPHQAVSAIKSSQRGLILITGPMSAGKTSTAQSILNHRNFHNSGHIVTIEDPIETELRSEKCLITPKEVGVDVASFHQGLIDALRQAADTMLIGELRDKDTIRAAISAAGSGILVVATVHGDTCLGALSRMMSLLGDEASGYWKVLSQSLICVVRQALVSSADGSGWVMVSDAMINRGQVSALLSKSDVAGLEQYTSGATKGDDWISMNDALRGLVTAKRVGLEQARRTSTDPKSIS
jgi:twitching motility protein PilT